MCEYYNIHEIPANSVLAHWFKYRGQINRLLNENIEDGRFLDMSHRAWWRRRGCTTKFDQRYTCKGSDICRPTFFANHSQIFGFICIANEETDKHEWTPDADINIASYY